jgi:hypothetical protein
VNHDYSGQTTWRISTKQPNMPEATGDCCTVSGLYRASWQDNYSAQTLDQPYISGSVIVRLSGGLSGTQHHLWEECLQRLIRHLRIRCAGSRAKAATFTPEISDAVSYHNNQKRMINISSPLLYLESIDRCLVFISILSM